MRRLFARKSAAFLPVIQKTRYAFYTDSFAYQDENKGYLRILEHVNRHRILEAELVFLEISSLKQSRHKKANRAFIPALDQESKPPLSEVPESLNDFLKETFKNCTSLLSKPSICISLLKDLDTQIAIFSKILGCDYSTIKPKSALFLRDSIQVPGELLDPPLISEKVDSEGLLWYLLRKILHRQNIEKSNTLLTFSGFVGTPIANAFVSQGHLFKEQFLSGNLLLHGIFSHLFHWVIFTLALEKKILTLKDNMTLRQLMPELVFFNQWANLMDFLVESPFNKHFLNFNLGSPYRLQSALLFSDEIPNIRGLMMTLFDLQAKEIQNQYELKYKQKLPYHCLVTGQSAAFNGVGSFNLGFSNEDIDRYLQMDSKHAFSFDHKTGVIKEDAKKRFAQFIQIEKKLAKKTVGFFSGRSSRTVNEANVSKNIILTKGV